MNETSSEKSCGAVVFIEQDHKFKYLLVKSLAGIWGFPKGHTIMGESEQQTALREIKEETNVDVNLLDGFRIVDEYVIPPKNATPIVNKQAVYFLATFRDQACAPQESKISEIALVDFDTAVSLFSFEGHKRILTSANAFLLSNTTF